MKQAKSTLKKFFPIVTIAAFTLLVSCKKENDNDGSVSEEEAVTLIAESITDSGSGLIASTVTTTSIAVNYTSYCGLAKDSTVTRSRIGVNASWSASLHWNWLLTCSGVTPSKFDLTYTGTSTYSGPRMGSNDQITGSATVTGLELSATAFTLNSSLVRTGTQVSKIGRKSTFSSVLTYTGTNITVSKSTKLVTGGTVAITLTGSTSNGKSFSYAATLVFSGNKAGVITLKNGSSYNVSW